MAPVEPLETAMLDPRRSAKVAALCGAVVLTAGCVAWFAGSGSTGVETPGAVPREDRPAAALAVEVAAAPQETEICKPAVVTADAAPAVEPAASGAADSPVAELETAISPGNTPVADRPTAAPVPVEPSLAGPALPDSSQIPAPEFPLVQVARASPSEPVLQD